MKSVKIDPGICGLITRVTAESEDGMDVTIKISSACKAVQQMYEELGSEYDAYEVCLCPPGENIFYDYARKHFPGHACCPTIAGIIKCVEAECHLALPKTVKIEFED